MGKLDEIKNQLASRLEKQAKESKNNEEQWFIEKEKKKEPKLGNQGQELKSIKSSISQNGALKLSVSLYDYDIVCLDKIKDFMRKQGIRKLTDSEALRIACRAVETNDNFLSIYEAMQLEDRRRKRN